MYQFNDFSTKFVVLFLARKKNYEIGLMWDDKNLKIKWPIKKPILSKKDSQNISFNEFCKKYNKR